MTALIKLTETGSKHPVFVNPGLVRLVKPGPDERQEGTCVVIFSPDHQIRVNGLAEAIAEQLSAASESPNEII